MTLLVALYILLFEKLSTDLMDTHRMNPNPLPSSKSGARGNTDVYSWDLRLVSLYHRTTLL